MTRLDFLLGWWRLRRSLEPATGRRAARSGRGGPRRRRPLLEPLEPRHLLAVDFTQLAKLLPTVDATDTSHAGDQFGLSVAVDGDTAVVGASGDDGAELMSGAAYVFARSESGWILQQKLTAADAFGDDGFGWRWLPEPCSVW